MKNIKNFRRESSAKYIGYKCTVIVNYNCILANIFWVSVKEPRRLQMLADQADARTHIDRNAVLNIITTRRVFAHECTELCYGTFVYSLFEYRYTYNGGRHLEEFAQRFLSFMVPICVCIYMYMCVHYVM